VVGGKSGPDDRTNCRSPGARRQRSVMVISRRAARRDTDNYARIMRNVPPSSRMSAIRGLTWEDSVKDRGQGAARTKSSWQRRPSPCHNGNEPDERVGADLFDTKDSDHRVTAGDDEDRIPLGSRCPRDHRPVNRLFSNSHQLGATSHSLRPRDYSPLICTESNAVPTYPDLSPEGLQNGSPFPKGTTFMRTLGLRTLGLRTLGLRTLGLRTLGLR
jgi:hypothetical protein